MKTASEHSNIASGSAPARLRAWAGSLPSAWRGIPFWHITLFAFMVSLAFENGSGDLRDALLWVSFGLLAWDLRGEWLVREDGVWDLPSWLGRIALWMAGGAGLTLAAMGLTAARGTTLGEGPASIAAEALKRLPPLCVAVPVLIRLVRRMLAGHAPGDRLARLTWGCVALWAAWMAASCAWSLDPAASLDHLFSDGGSYLVLYAMIWLMLARGGRTTALNWLTALTLAGAGVALAAILLGLVGWLGSRELALRMAELDLLRVNWSEYGRRVIRVQFPFREHNRLASWLLAALTLAPAALALGAGRGQGQAPEPGEGAWRRWMLGGAVVVILTAIVLTGTRGALAAAVAMLGVLALSRPKLLLAAVPVLLLALALMPGSMRAHIGTLVDLETYRNPQGSVLYRYIAYENTLKMIAERPVLGFGYGWSIYEELYPSYDTEGADIELKPHAHNNVLEISAELGLTGGGLYLALQLLLALGALRLIRRGPTRESRALGWALLAALVALNAFGLTNYNLRRTVGYWVWGVFAAVSGVGVRGFCDKGSKSNERTPLKIHNIP